MKTKKPTKDYEYIFVFILLVAIMIYLFYSLPYTFYKANKELYELNNQRIEIQKQIILPEEMDKCNKFYLLSLSSWNIHEKNYWLNMQTNCILLKDLEDSK